MDGFKVAAEGVCGEEAGSQPRTDGIYLSVPDPPVRLRHEQVPVQFHYRAKVRRRVLRVVRLVYLRKDVRASQVVVINAVADD